MAGAPRPDHLAWQSAKVGGRRVRYGEAGDGMPVLFFHGWALGQHAYKRALKRLVRQGCHVLAPALPGFGGSRRLAGLAPGLGEYAAWASEFLDAVGVDEPVLAIGHSFGGAVAAQLAHDFPERVAFLTLVNSIGGAPWTRSGDKVRLMAERPLWDWAVHFPKDILAGRGALSTVKAILEDAVPNLLANPVGVWHASIVARQADLAAELGALRQRQVPVLVLWGEGDGIIPRASFEALCEAIGVAGKVVPGGHSWMLADPERFGEALAATVAAALAARPKAPPVAQVVELRSGGASRAAAQ